MEISLIDAATVEFVDRLLEALPDDAVQARAVLATALSDESGFYAKRILPDGRTFGVVIQFMNFKLTLSQTDHDPCWLESW